MARTVVETAGRALMLLMLLAVTLLASAPSASAGELVTAPDHVAAAGSGYSMHLGSWTMAGASVPIAYPTDNRVVVPGCDSCCCGTGCQAVADTAKAIQFLPAAGGGLPVPFASAPPRESLVPDAFRPPIA